MEHLGRADFVGQLTPLVGDAAAGGMWQHWQLVEAAQRETNLTGVRSAAAALQIHYLDALAALPHWPLEANLLDIGSGAGFPGLVLALARPTSQVTLVEPRRLRAAFLAHAIAELGLLRVQLVASRVETMPAQLHACLTMRAVYAGEDKLAGLVRVAAPNAKLLIFRQGEAPARDVAGRWRRQASHPYGRSANGAKRRLDEWTLGGAVP